MQHRSYLRASLSPEISLKFPYMPLASFLILGKYKVLPKIFVHSLDEIIVVF